MADVTGLYDQLTGQERLTLTIEAYARVDDADAGRLKATCPVRTYRMGDEEFWGRFEFAGRLTTWAYVDIAIALTRLRWSRHVGGALPGLLGWVGDAMASLYLGGHAAGWNQARDNPDAPYEQPTLEDAGEAAVEAEESDEESEQWLEQAGAMAAELLEEHVKVFLMEIGACLGSMLVTQVEGFGRWTRQDLGVEPLVALKGLGIDTTDLEEALASCSNAEPEEDRAAEVQASLHRAWARRFPPAAGASAGQ